MTATALRGPLHTPPGSTSGDAEFLAACERRDYVLLQDALAGMTTREAVEHLAALFPHRTPRWFARNLYAIRNLDADQLGRFLGYADPTGDTATERVYRERMRAAA